MNAMRSVLLVAALVAAAAGGYWLGSGQRAAEGRRETEVQRPMQTEERKILYYRNPMGLADTSPIPKKDAMGMDYVPVYAGDEDASGQIAIGADKVQKLGVKTELAALRALDRSVRAVGRVEIDERRIHSVAPKFEGWVEKLYANATGEPVRQGQPLLEVYSPELVSAQREYAIAAQGLRTLENASQEAQAGMRQLAEASLARLKNWDVSAQQLEVLAQSGNARRALAFYAPVSGVVLEKKALSGMRFMPGEMLYRIADLSVVWVIADVYEQDIATVRPGSRAKISVSAYPERVFEGTVSYVYPTLQAETRTVQVRLEIPNPGLLLKPAMYAQVEFSATPRAPVLSVPTSAVIDSGTRRIVLVQVAQGRFEPREVQLGRRGDNYVEVLGGVGEGEAVVVSANFLIDAESNLRAALGAFGAAGAPGGHAATDAGTALPAADDRAGH